MYSHMRRIGYFDSFYSVVYGDASRRKKKHGQLTRALSSESRIMNVGNIRTMESAYETTAQARAEGAREAAVKEAAAKEAAAKEAAAKEAAAKEAAAKEAAAKEAAAKEAAAKEAAAKEAGVKEAAAASAATRDTPI